MTGTANPAACDTDLGLPFALDLPLRSLADYVASGQTLTPETMLGVKGARVIFANYGVIRADFAPFIGHLLAGGEGECRRALDTWIVGNTAFVSTTQAASTVVSTPIPLDGITKPAWRPPQYGRAAVLIGGCGPDPARGALFDVKGTGVPPDEVPVLPHSNGLMTLGEAVHEVLMEHLVFAVTRRAGVDVCPLPSYAVVDLGFDATWHDERPPGRAVALRAAPRPRHQWSRAVQGPAVARTLMWIELIMRASGISSSDCGAVRLRLTMDGEQPRIFRDGAELDIPPERKAEVFRTAGWQGQDVIADGVNVQITCGLSDSPLRARIIDFGRYRFRERFNSVLYSWFDADYLSMNGAYLRPGDASYQQPDPFFGLGRFESSDEHHAVFATVAAYQRAEVDRSALTAAMRRAVDAAATRLAGASLPLVAAPQPHAVPSIAFPDWTFQAIE